MSLRQMFKLEFDPGAGYVVAMLCITASFAACEMATAPHILVDEELPALPECPECVCPQTSCPVPAPTAGPTARVGPAPPVTAELVDLNHAGPAELTRLPGVGPGTARRIIDHRSKRPFGRTRDVMRVRGIGRRKYLKIKPFVKVSPRAKPVRRQTDTGP